MNDMIPIEALVGMDEDGEFWVRISDIEENLEMIVEGPFETQADAENYITDMMNLFGGINMGSIHDTKH